MCSCFSSASYQCKQSEFITQSLKCGTRPIQFSQLSLVLRFGVTCLVSQWLNEARICLSTGKQDFNSKFQIVLFRYMGLLIYTNYYTYRTYL